MSSHFLNSITAEVLGIDELFYKKLSGFFTTSDLYENAFTIQILKHSLDISYSEAEEIIKKLVELDKIRVISKRICPNCLFEIQSSDLNVESCIWCNLELLECDEQDYFELIESSMILEELEQEPEIEYIYQYKPNFIFKTKIDEKLREIYRRRTLKYSVLHEADIDIFRDRDFVIYQSRSISICLDVHFAYILFDKHDTYADYMREIPILENKKEISEIFTSYDVNSDFKYIIKHDHFPNLIDTFGRDTTRITLLDDAIQSMYVSAKRNDYSPLTVPSFRILETLLKLFLDKGGIPLNHTFCQFKQDPPGSLLFVLKPEYLKITTLKPNEIRELEDLYSLYNTRRHPLLHVEKLDPQGGIEKTLIHENFNETYELVYSVLTKAEESCSIFK